MLCSEHNLYYTYSGKKTSYELFKGRKPSIPYFHKFQWACYILNNKVYLKKYNAKDQKGIFLG